MKRVAEGEKFRVFQDKLLGIWTYFILEDSTNATRSQGVDYNVKIKALSKFIGGGNKVKVSMRFKGREMEHQNLGFDLLKKLTTEVEEYAKVEVPPKFEGKQIMMILVPQVAK